MQNKYVKSNVEMTLTRDSSEIILSELANSS